MSKTIRRWFVSAYDRYDHVIEPADIGLGQQHFRTLGEAQQECHRLLQRFSDENGPEPYVAFCNILVAAGRATRVRVQTVVHNTQIEPYTDDDTDPGVPVKVSNGKLVN
jgi:hypothetical protein